jgi:hypothetical protein
LATKQELFDLIETHREHKRCGFNTGMNYDGWVCQAHECFCMTIPKVACSTVKVTLHQLKGFSLTGDLSNIHDQGKHLTDFNTDKAIEILTSSRWFRFCFVRNPYHRLFSAYKSKIGNSWEKQYIWLQDRIRESFGYPIGKEGRVGMVAFRDFVRFLRNASQDVWNDGHLNLQTNILLLEMIQYDFIGRFENFKVDFQKVLTRMNASPAVLSSANQVRNPTVQIPLAAAYDSELASWVYEMYLEDFENFGYDRDSWMFDQ